jgi:diguanylate cyclase (GGDEF)-like protein
MDPLTVTAGIAAVAGFGVAWQMHRRAARAEAATAILRGELLAERHAASHDALTGLPNRRAFYQVGAALVADPRRHPLIAVVVDLDDFKQVNDRFGHAAGDEVLITIARRFAGCAGENLVARLGGDEFAGLLTTPTIDERWLSHTERSFADALGAPMRISGHDVRVTVSVGMVAVPPAAHLAEALRRADAAMYRAKGSGAGASARALADGVSAQVAREAAWLNPSRRYLVDTTPRTEN